MVPFLLLLGVMPNSDGGRPIAQCFPVEMLSSFIWSFSGYDGYEMCPVKLGFRVKGPLVSGEGWNLWHQDTYLSMFGGKESYGNRLLVDILVCWDAFPTSLGLLWAGLDSKCTPGNWGLKFIGLQWGKRHLLCLVWVGQRHQ